MHLYADEDVEQQECAGEVRASERQYGRKLLCKFAPTSAKQQGT
jgi:hypothetical protein